MECLAAFVRGPDWVAVTDAEKEAQRHVSTVGALLIVEFLKGLRNGV